MTLRLRSTAWFVGLLALGSCVGVPRCAATAEAPAYADTTPPTEQGSTGGARQPSSSEHPHQSPSPTQPPKPDTTSAHTPRSSKSPAFCPPPLAHQLSGTAPMAAHHLRLLQMAAALGVRDAANDEAEAGIILRAAADISRDKPGAMASDVSRLAGGEDGALHRNELFNLPGFALLRTDAEATEHGEGTNVEASAPVPHDRLDEAMQLILLGMDARAGAELDAFLKEHPDHSDAWRFLGDCRYRLGETHGAQTAYERALALSRTNYFALRGKAQCHLQMAVMHWNRDEKPQAHEEYRMAQALFLQCLQQQPADGDARYGHALAAEGLTRHLLPLAMRGLDGAYAQEAKDVIRNCMEILDNAVTVSRDRLRTAPEDHEARLVLADLLVKRGKVLHPFGHIEEARENVEAASKELRRILDAEAQAFTSLARERLASCHTLIAAWQSE